MPDQIMVALNKKINLGIADPNIKAWLAELGSAPPEVIAQVNDDEDVIAAVKCARAKKLKAAVRGGGHN
jgi:FAD/FMN-containing dehydrogenase